MDRASQALAYGVPSGVHRSYRTVADHSGVLCSTLYHRAHGRRSLEAKAQAQQYLAPFEEQAVVKFILQMAEIGTPIRIKHIPSIAFTTSIAEGALLQEDNRFVRKMNNEAKVRRSTKSLVLGKAKVMSYEDLEAARLKRLQKEADKASKSKRGRKRKDEAKKACISGVVVDVVQSEASEFATCALQVNEPRHEDDVGVLSPCPSRAPIARMW
jgi:hypothetical protein